MMPKDTVAVAQSHQVAFDVGDVVLRGDQWNGQGRGHVIFLHGGGQTRHAWRWSAEQLAAAGWAVTTLDLRGHGDSDWAPDGDYKLERYAEDVGAVIGELGMRPVIVGASLGGLTALTLQSIRAVARALVLVDIVPRTATAGTDRISTFMSSHLDGFETLDAVAHAVARYKDEPVRSMPSGLRKTVRQRDDGRWYWHWDPKVMNLRSERRNPDDPLFGAASRIFEPILVIRGMLSDVVDEAGVNEFLEQAHHARSVEVAGAGHMVAGDNNHPFFYAVEEFLESLPD